MSTSAVDIQQLAINTIRTLSMDAVQAANSGHPGTPMALAPVAYELWTNHLNYDPDNPHWMGRDRFVLSCGHASMLLYSLLHVASVKKDDGATELSITLDNIKNFRQLSSPCAGHPEFGHAAGIETTTGPLGQGVVNALGMAIASKWQSANYGGGTDLLDYDVYALCSDGDIMEGVACEAASIAGHLKLDNLCWIYDDNEITIEGRTDLAFSEDVPKRFDGLGWNVITVTDANDLKALGAAFKKFKATTDKPTLIVVKSIIGFGAPNKQDTSGAHGSPLGDDEIVLAKEAYGWPNEKFRVPEEVIAHFSETLGERGREAYAKWSDGLAGLSGGNKDAIQQMAIGAIPKGWEDSLPVFDEDAKGMATRVSSGKVINAIAGSIPWMIGGSADLAGSTKTIINDDSAGHFSADDYSGRNFHFGIREHAMASLCNGMALSGVRPYCATFFVFTDYLRPAMRLSALMHQPVVYVLTHDSIGLGEDGPTHQPVEHLAACRSIPGLLVMRPADANEVASAYRVAMNETKRPSALVLTRQNVPSMSTADRVGTPEQGGYVVWQSSENPDTILMASGSEVSICIEAAKTLADQGKSVRVVSMLCWKLFDEQPESYRESILPSLVTNRVAVEAGIEQGWQKYIGSAGTFIGMNSFGASAPFEKLYEHFGITAKAIVEAAG